MLDHFTKKPFKERIKDTGYLIKHSFKVIHKDKDIKTPIIHLIVYFAVMTTLIFASLLFFFTGRLVVLGILLLLFTIFVMGINSFFFNVRRKANMSWLVYNTITGKDISYKDAHAHTKSEKGKLRLIAFVDLVMNLLKSQRRSRKGIVSIIISLFLRFLEEVWDLLSHYMLPAVVVEQRPLKQIIPEIKALKTNVPAALVGVFGIDFVGNVVGMVLFPVYLIILALGVGIGFLIALFTETTAVTFLGITFSWVPVLLMLYIVILIGGGLDKIVQSIKVIYFTIFYTSIKRPMEITPGMRGELTNYLLMKEADFMQKPETPRQKYISQLAGYVKQYESSGHTPEQIKTFLLSKGYSASDIDAALKNAQKLQ